MQVLHCSKTALEQIKVKYFLYFSQSKKMLKMFCRLNKNLDDLFQMWRNSHLNSCQGNKSPEWEISLLFWYLVKFLDVPSIFFSDRDFGDTEK